MNPIWKRRSAQSEKSAVSLIETCLAAASDAKGEGARVFTELFAQQSLAAARSADERAHGADEPRALEGMPISVKDLFDVNGYVTRAGSLGAMAEALPAAADAIAISRLRAAGAIIVGKTNMTEFAYSGVGINPHYGTPLNPFDRNSKRIPGGSSSGAAVSVSDNMAAAAIGTDTGGSVRIPAALCGLVGFKPTATRIPLDGALPLSASLDSVGVIAADVSACALLDSVMSGVPLPLKPARTDVAGVRLRVPSALLDDNADSEVTVAMHRVLRLLRDAGAEIVESAVPEIEAVPARGAGPVIVASEAFAWHRGKLDTHGASYDPRVRSRLQRGSNLSAWEYLDALRCRSESISAAARALQGFDGWLMPTVPIIAPPISSFARDEEFTRLNALLLRNPSIVNFLNGCAISLPCHRPGEAPVGLTVAGPGNSDSQLLRLAADIERVISKGT